MQHTKRGSEGMRFYSLGCVLWADGVVALSPAAVFVLCPMSSFLMNPKWDWLQTIVSLIPLCHWFTVSVTVVPEAWPPNSMKFKQAMNNLIPMIYWSSVSFIDDFGPKPVMCWCGVCSELMSGIITRRAVSDRFGALGQTSTGIPKTFDLFRAK